MVFEILFILIIISFAGYRQYQTQEYRLDRQLAKFIRKIKKLWQCLNLNLLLQQICLTTYYLLEVKIQYSQVSRCNLLFSRLFYLMKIRPEFFRSFYCLQQSQSFYFQVHADYKQFVKIWQHIYNFQSKYDANQLIIRQIADITVVYPNGLLIQHMHYIHALTLFL